jgi:dTDP-4-dehydrorhamnose 3,5-epimerase
MKVSSKYTGSVTSQSYGRKTQIEGVITSDLDYFNDDGGNFAELARVTNGRIEGMSPEFEVRQLSMSLMVPGTIKAYHLHYNQEDIWFVPPTDRLLVNLHDVREDSPTSDQHMRLVLGGGGCSLLRIPAGVAHGAANLYTKDMFLFYATSAQFNAEQPDEQRLPWDTFGEDVWELTRG